MVKVVNILDANGYRKTTVSILGRSRHDARTADGSAEGDKPEDPTIFCGKTKSVVCNQVLC